MFIDSCQEMKLGYAFGRIPKQRIRVLTNPSRLFTFADSLSTSRLVTKR